MSRHSASAVATVIALALFAAACTPAAAPPTPVPTGNQKELDETWEAFSRYLG